MKVDAGVGAIVADPGRLRQVLLNLLRNAVVASPATEPIHVIGKRFGDSGYEIAVADRGPGVPPADAAKIFEPFYSRHGGSGLGLAVCQGIVVAHGGEIDVGSRPGGGAVFRVVLPARPSHAGGQAKRQ